MLKSLLAAAAVALPLSLMAAAPASAGVDFQVYLGLPHFNYNPGYGYVLRPGFGWYNPRVTQLSCTQGGRLLERRGYQVRAALECSGSRYKYRVRNLRGKVITINLNARTGQAYK